MSGQVPYVSQSVGMTAADAQQVGTDQTVVASTTSLTDINNVVRVTASLTGASITGNCAVSGNVSASSLAVTGAVTFSSINSTPIGATTQSTGAFTTLVGTNGASIKGTVNPTSGQSVEIYHSGSVGQIYSYDRTGSAWLPLLVYGSTVTLYGSNVLGLTVAGGGRVLVGTTTDDGVNALQVNGTAKATSIKFANTGGTKQALDYYEEGTWTPTLGGTATYNTLTGSYTRVGRQVTAHFVVDVLAIGTGATMSVSGLPFACGSLNRGGGGVTYVASPAIACASITPVVIPTFQIINFITSSILGVWNNTSAVFGTGTIIAGTVTYFI